MMATRSARRAKLVAGLPQSRSPHKGVTRRSRSASPGNALIGLRTKKAKLEKEKAKDKTPKTAAPAYVQTTPKTEPPTTLDKNLDGTDTLDGIADTANSTQTTPLSIQTPPITVRSTPASTLATPLSSQTLPTLTQAPPKSQEAGTPSTTPKMRTRLSTGSIQMNGTMTVSAKQEKAELEQIIKQISKNETVTPTRASTFSNLKKRTSQGPVTLLESSDHPPPKKRKIGRNDGSGEDNRNDYFCWLCHKEGTLVCCELCPRVYHTRCLGLSAALPQDWVCPECEKIMRAECVDTRSKSMEMLTIDQLCTLLKYALDRMKHGGSEPFQKPVDLNAVPNYTDYIFHPMDLSTLEKNIKKKMYGSTEALLADAKWILHNCIIYNGAHNKLTTSAKMIIKICKHEMNEIELCPDCYLNSCVRKNDEWFSEPCRVPHTLVWAKLKGYPFWPSKALREVDGQVDVRFFGAHDRSWVPVSQCFLLSKNIPTSLHGKKNNGLDMAIEELNLHIKKLKDKFGNFQYAPFRTPYDKTDIYKPINVKPDAMKNVTSSWQMVGSGTAKPEILSPRKLSTNSSMSGNKPNILKRSAVAKTASALRNKYSAMVSLKKLDISAELGGRKEVNVDDNCSKSVKDNEENVKLTSESVGDSNVRGGCSRENNEIEERTKIVPSKSVESHKTENGKPQRSESKSEKVESKVTVSENRVKSDKGIKKSYVSSTLLEKLEEKLKALDAENTEKPADPEATQSVVAGGKRESSESETAGNTEVTVVLPKPDNSEAATSFGTEEQKGLPEEQNTCSGDEASRPVKEKTDTGKHNLIKVLSLAGSKVVDTDSKVCLNEDSVKEAEALIEDKDIGKESRDSYRQKLESMIKSCKEKLGVEINETAEFDSALSDDNDESENESSSENDDSDDDSSDNENNEKDTEKVEESQKDNVKLTVSDSDQNKKEDNLALIDKEKEKVSVKEIEKTKNSKTCGTEVETNSSVSKIKDKSESEIVAESKLNENDSTTSDQIVNEGCTERFSDTAQTGKEKEISESLVDEITEKVQSDKQYQMTSSKKDREFNKEILTNKSSDQSDVGNKEDTGTKELQKRNDTKTRKEDVLGDPVVHEAVETVKVVEHSQTVPVPTVKGTDETAAKKRTVNALDPVSGEFMEKLTEDEDSESERLVIDLDEKEEQIRKTTKLPVGKNEKTKTSPVSAEKDSTMEISSDTSFGSSPVVFNKSANKSFDKSVNDPVDISSDSSTATSPNLKCKAPEKTVSKPLTDHSGEETEDSNRNVVLVNKRNDKSTSFSKPVSKVDSIVASKRRLAPKVAESLLGKKGTDGPFYGNHKISPVVEEARSVLMPVDSGIEGNDVPTEEMEDVVELLDDEGDIPLDLDSCLPNKDFRKPEETLSETATESQSASKLAEKFSKKLLETIQKTMDEMCAEVLKEKSKSQNLELMGQQLAQVRWQYCAELNELRHNFQLTLYEMKSGWESEKAMFVKEITGKLIAEKEQAVKETKKKQWCAQCGKEAIFYCCWNTSYCDYPCQQSHWPQHMHSCLQTNKEKNSTSNASISNVASSSVQTLSQTGIVSAGPVVNPVTSIPISTPPSDGDHLRRLQENLNAAIQREEEKRGEQRPGVSPKFTTPMSSPQVQNLRQPGLQQLPMFNMQASPQASMMQQFQRARFIGQQQMMPVQQRGNIPQSQQVNPRMVFSQPLIQQTIYPVQVAQQQQLGGTILFPQSAQQNLMTYGMPPRPY